MCIQSKIKFFVFSEEELMELGKIAQEELLTFLEKNPEYKEFQNIIDRRIKKAEKFENRMMTLGLSFQEARLMEN